MTTLLSIPESIFTLYDQHRSAVPAAYWSANASGVFCVYLAYD